MRKPRSRTVAVILVLSVGLLLLWDSRLVAHLRFAGNAHIPSADEDFPRLSEVIPSQTAPLSSLLRGLPHPARKEKEYVRELWTSSNVSVHGYRFYKEPVAISPELREVLAGLLSDPSAFTAYTGPKLCDGYHADFAARFDEPGRTCWVLVCFGCEEVLMYSGRQALICELRPRAYKALYKAWQKTKTEAGEARATSANPPDR